MNLFTPCTIVIFSPNPTAQFSYHLNVYGHQQVLSRYLWEVHKRDRNNKDLLHDHVREEVDLEFIGTSTLLRHCRVQYDILSSHRTEPESLTKRKTSMHC